MLSDLNVDILTNAIQNFKDKQGWGALETLTAGAKLGGGEVSRILKGTRRVRFETWWKLHKAFPDDIPPPTLTTNEVLTFHDEYKAELIKGPIENERLRYLRKMYRSARAERDDETMAYFGRKIAEELERLE